MNSSYEELGTDSATEVKIEKPEEVMEVIEGDGNNVRDILNTTADPVKLEVRMGDPFAKMVQSENVDGSGNIIPVKIGRKIVKLVRVNGTENRDITNKQVIVIPDGARDETSNIRNIKLVKKPTTNVTPEDNLITFLKEAIIKPFST